MLRIDIIYYMLGKEEFDVKNGIDIRCKMKSW